ncbi:hypothetical protein Amuc02_09230 [Akkermansia muciniphila]|nr:hypothetical protein Amuc02_09230 [Akkermansia muciniphila]
MAGKRDKITVDGSPYFLKQGVAIRGSEIIIKIVPTPVHIVAEIEVSTFFFL